MTEVILGGLAALAIRDIIYEIVNRYNQYQRRRNMEIVFDMLEDIDADDDD